MTIARIGGPRDPNQELTKERVVYELRRIAQLVEDGATQPMGFFVGVMFKDAHPIVLWFERGNPIFTGGLLAALQHEVMHEVAGGTQRM